MKATTTLFFVLFSLANVAETPATPPNVVILLTDDQGTLDANCYGSADLKTPNMDKLALLMTRLFQPRRLKTMRSGAQSCRVEQNAKSTPETRCRTLLCPISMDGR